MEMTSRRAILLAPGAAREHRGHVQLIERAVARSEVTQ